VFTHRDLEPVAGADLHFTSDPVEQVHAQMAAVGDGDVWVVGGGRLATDFAAAGLLDEIVVSIASVTLGSGRLLFPGRFDLELIDHGRNKAFLLGRYKVLGALTEDR
jgi:dihydrofolate reductase